MTRRSGRLFILAILVSGLSVYFSCSQPDDILIPVSRTDLYLWGKEVVPGTPNLKPQNLPTNPEGMIYELWVANDQETLSLGKFGWHQFPQLTFHDENGNLRPDSNHFVLEADIYNYSHIFVSVETNPDSEPLVPGPIMLIDDVTNPKNDPIELRFPLSDSLWNATTRFCMETPSDGDRDSLDGYGIWFAYYYEKRADVQDTFRLDSFKIDTSWQMFDKDTNVAATVDVLDIQDSVYTRRILGFDTVWYYRVQWRDSIEIDSTPEDSFLTTKVTYYFDMGDTVTIVYDDFGQDNFALPDYSAYGWNYKGWVVSPEVPVNFGQITPPAYLINTNQTDSLITGIEGGLLTTGTFTRIDDPDDSNPYSLGPRVPPFPGEDFLTNLPGGLKPPPGGSWGGLVPEASGNTGTVFITLEPVNFVTDTTNFPLFVMVRAIPSTRSSVTATSQEFTMKNLVHTNDQLQGFPKIVVDIQRR